MTSRRPRRPRAYAPDISTERDDHDLAAELERLFEEQPEPASPSRPSAAPPIETEPAAPPIPTGPASASELRREMDELRDQLEQAFAEVFNRIDALDAYMTQLRGLTGLSIDASEQAAAAVAELRVALTAGGGIVGQLRSTGETLATALERSVEELHKEARVPKAGLKIDTRALEKTASEGALRNAADIANLREDLDGIAAAVRSQTEGITELRATIEWIKERLLLR